MGILHRYVLREVAAASLTGTLLLTLVLFLQRVEPVMELLVGRGAPAAEMLWLFALTVPQAFPFTIPMGVVTGILVALGRLSGDNEILAMAACGMPRRALVGPVALVATAGLVSCAATTLWLTPWSLREQVRSAETFRIRLAGTEVAPRVFIEHYPDHVIWVQDVVPGDGAHWKGVFLADMRSPEERGSLEGFNVTVEGPRITLASEAFVLPRPDQHRIQIRFPLTTTYERSRDPARYLTFRSQDADQIMQARPQRFDPAAKTFDRMDTPTLWREANRAADPQARILLQGRFSLPFACWVLPLVGIPLAVAIRGAGRSFGVALALVLCFGYWMVTLAGAALSEQGLAPAAPAVWAANAVFLLAGAVLLRRLDAPTRHDWNPLRGMRLAWRFKRLAVRWLRRGAVGTGRGRASRPSVSLIPVVDRYMLRSFLFYLLVCVAAFTALWYVFSFFELLNDMLARDKLGRLVPYLYYLTPFLIYNTTPLAVMVATLVCIGLLASRHELTAFRACGVSLYRLACPILLVAAGLSAGLFVLEETYLPESNRRQDALRDEIKGRPPRTYLRPDRQWTFGLQDRIFYHRAFDSHAKAFSGISIYDLRREPFELLRHIAAERARWDAAGGFWTFENGWVRTFDGIRTTAFEEFEKRSFQGIEEPPDYFLKQARHDQQMDLGQLRAYIADLTQSGFDTTGLRVRLHKKLAFPLFAFSMALAAVPFALRTGQRGAMWPVCFGLGLIVLYYASNAFAEQLGRAGQLEPPLAAWAPGLLFALGGSYLLLRVRT